MNATRTRPAAALALALLLAATLTAMLAAAPALAVEAELLPVGSPAPAFESVDVDGQPFQLTEAVKQGPVLLVFWSLFCGTCRDELPILQAEKPKYEGKVQFVTVNLDEAPRARTVKGFAKQQGFTFRLLLNKVEQKAADGTVAVKEYQVDQTYKIKATPALYLVNRDGTIGFAHYGALNPDDLAGVLGKLP
jgi:peroxiredoxin